MKRKRCALLILLLALLVLSGCSKDELIGGYNDALELAGDLPVAWNPLLKGEREFGASHYVGTYAADYQSFSGTEYLFGGTSLETPEGATLTITCDCEAESGEMELLFYSLSAEPTVLGSSEAPYAGEVELPAGSNYIAVRGDGFTGSLSLKVE